MVCGSIGRLAFQRLEQGHLEYSGDFHRSPDGVQLGVDFVRIGPVAGGTQQQPASDADVVKDLQQPVDVVVGGWRG